MRFLVDESTGPAVAHWLHGQGHADRLADHFVVVTESRVRFARR
ncbi:MAG TPA: hypothetical protein VFL17_07320 [Anaerolineae bacterium]|nr:hypothetical protein [Anaerolineae bacterium]